MAFRKLFKWQRPILLKKKRKTMLIWVITDQEIRRRYFWSWLHVMIGGLQIMTRSFIDTSYNNIGIFANILGLFYVLQYCLPFKLRLQKKILARGSWVLFYMFIFHHWFWLKWRLFFRQNVFCHQILTVFILWGSLFFFTPNLLTMYSVCVHDV